MAGVQSCGQFACSLSQGLLKAAWLEHYDSSSRQESEEEKRGMEAKIDGLVP
jgi:hypothetical protein